MYPGSILLSVSIQSPVWITHAIVYDQTCAASFPVLPVKAGNQFRFALPLIISFFRSGGPTEIHMES